MNTMRLLKFRQREPKRKAGTWANLPPPLFASDNEVMAKAQSLLTGSLIGGVCPPLTPDQARDVCQWHQPMESNNV